VNAKCFGDDRGGDLDDELAVSLDLPTPAFSDEAGELVITTLGRIARQRHGTLALLRTLARRQRAPSHVGAF
jgi:hypothetical protein